MPVTYESIATTTVSGSSTNTVTFSSIPQTYTDLILVTSFRAISDVYFSGANVILNNDTGQNYNQMYIQGYNNTFVSGYWFQTFPFIFLDNGGNTVKGGFSKLEINSYSATNIKKPFIAQTIATNVSNMISGVWNSNSAISTLTVTMSGGLPNFAFAAGSQFTLYGILKA